MVLAILLWSDAEFLEETAGEVGLVVEANHIHCLRNIEVMLFNKQSRLLKPDIAYVLHRRHIEELFAFSVQLLGRD